MTFSRQGHSLGSALDRLSLCVLCAMSHQCWASPQWVHHPVQQVLLFASVQTPCEADSLACPASCRFSLPCFLVRALFSVSLCLSGPSLCFYFLSQHCFSVRQCGSLPAIRGVSHLQNLTLSFLFTAFLAVETVLLASKLES